MARSEPLEFRAGEVTLAGTLVVPDGGARHPWVLLLASWLPRDRDGAWDRLRHTGWFADDDGGTGLLARLATALAGQGVASFRYDKRGCGRSAGDWSRAGLFVLIDDARDAIGALRGRAELDLRRTGLCGHGEGATLALSVAIADPAVSALTLIAPAARSWRDVLRRGVAERSRSGADREHPVVAALDRSSEELIERADRREPDMTIRIGPEATSWSLGPWEQAIHTPGLALATMLHRSVSVVGGERDAWAHPDEADLLAGVLVDDAGVSARRWRVPDAGHDLAKADDDVIAAIAADLAARIVPRELPPVLLAIEGADSSR